MTALQLLDPVKRAPTLTPLKSNDTEPEPSVSWRCRPVIVRRPARESAWAEPGGGEEAVVVAVVAVGGHGDDTEMGTARPQQNEPLRNTRARAARSSTATRGARNTAAMVSFGFDFG